MDLQDFVLWSSKHPSGATNHLSVSSDFSRHSWSPDVHYHVHKSTLPDLISNPTNHHFTRSHCLSPTSMPILSPHLRLSLPSNKALSDFRLKFLIQLTSLPKLCYISHPLYSLSLCQSNIICCRARTVNRVRDFSFSQRRFTRLKCSEIWRPVYW